MKEKCPSCGAHNQHTFVCVIRKILLNLSSNISAFKSSNSNLNKGIKYYENKDYVEAEAIFEKVLEEDPDDYISTLYLLFTKHKQINNFLMLMNGLQEVLQATINTPNHEKIYQEAFSYIDSWLEPEFRLECAIIEIEWDDLIDALNFVSIEEAEKQLSDLRAFYIFILSFPKNYPKLFLKSLIKRYEYPWASSWWSRDKILSELELLKGIDLLLKQNMEETKILFSTLSDLHLKIIRLFLKTRTLKNHRFGNEQMISWNVKINDLFNSINFTDYELGFSHKERIEPYVEEMNKSISQLS